MAQHDAELRGAARGALAVHSLVPDLLKGAPRPKARGLRRAEMLKAKLVSALRAQYAAARPAAARHEPRREVARPLEQRGPPVREPPRAAAREHERRPRRAAGLRGGGVILLTL